MAITVLCPTRGRPDSAWDVVYSMEQTKTHPATAVLFIVDDDDPKLDEYQKARADETLPILVAPPDLEKGMVSALNWGASKLLTDLPETELVGFIGDDHRFRTKGWDSRFLEYTRRQHAAMVYANDGARIDIPTQVFMTSNVIQALGWMAPPFLHHLYVDDAWKAIGDAAGIIHVIPSILIEHMHPAFKKGEWDEGYRRVNSEEMYGHDGTAFRAWVQSPGFAEDVARVLAVV